jgi:hypothetical protein
MQPARSHRRAGLGRDVESAVRAARLAVENAAQAEAAALAPLGRQLKGSSPITSSLQWRRPH